jgi:hypothetical protein
MFQIFFFRVDNKNLKSLESEGSSTLRRNKLQSLTQLNNAKSSP